MVNEKLGLIGDELNISKADIQRIQKANTKNNFLYWVLSAIIALLSLILGFFVGKGTCSSAGGGGYPFSMGLVPVALTGKEKNSKVVVLLVSVIAFLVALNAVPVFGQAIEYNVYKRRG